VQVLEREIRRSRNSRLRRRGAPAAWWGWGGWGRGYSEHGDVSARTVWDTRASTW